MGIVYLAEDTKLDRLVAIKFLPQRISANKEERERFKIEAKAAAALNHANISTIHSIEEIDDQLFIVMEYIDGQELKSIVGAHRDGPLNVNEIIDNAIQIAEGLQAAHKKNIVHRDIKAGNIMVTVDGQIKIMDFGLAKVQGSEQLTREGTTIGTAAYMSPEQASHEEVDARSDIWSFGVILYEMFTQKLPFRGDYEAAILYDIVHADPQSLSSVRPDLPVKLSDIVDRCLEKDKSKRYQTISEIIEDLKSLQSVSGISEESMLSSSSENSSSFDNPVIQKHTSTSKKVMIFAISFLAIIILVFSIFIFSDKSESESIISKKKMLVVLPFKNLGAAEQDYFADGITGEITSRLSGLSGLGVIARSSAMQYKNTDKSIAQIGDELGVEYLLEGTVQWENLGDGTKRVRVNPELIKISNATQIWSKPYESDFSSVFKLQSEIATQVATAMNITLLSGEEKSIEQELTTNSEAFDYYLRGLEYHLDTYNFELWQIALQMYNRAIELDPQFAAAHARVSSLHSDMYWFHYDRSENRLQMAWEAIKKAEQINPNLYLLHNAKGWYYYHGFLDYEKALKEFYKALEFHPNDEDAYMGIASVLRRQGEVNEAAIMFKKAISMNPRSSLNYDQLGETLFLLRQYDDARKNLEHSISLTPDDAVAYPFLALTYLIEDQNTKRGRKLLEDHLKNAGARINEFRFFLTAFDLFDRKYDNALQQINKMSFLNTQFRFLPKEVLAARVYGYKNETERMTENYKKAQKIVEAKIEEVPEDERYYSSLGIIYAGLGDKEKAIKYGMKGIELLPVSKEFWRGSFREEDMAIIYTMLGEEDKAIELLNRLLSRPYDLSVTWLKLDPMWDPLRDNPRFLSLLSRHKK
jgi:serine/threonine protein kinase/tetratricopeptide (TPR) repeat protein